MASPVKITVISDENIDNKVKAKIVRVEGQLDESNVDDQAQVMYGIIEELPKGTNLILDLSELTYLNSKAIGYLTDWHLKMSENGSEILLLKARENILDILNVVGLTQIVKNYINLEEAKLAILNKASQ